MYCYRPSSLQIKFSFKHESTLRHQRQGVMARIAADGNDYLAILGIEHGLVVVARRGNQRDSHVAVRAHGTQGYARTVFVREEGVEGGGARIS